MLRMMDVVAAPKMPPLRKMSWSCTPWLCVIGGETCEVRISLGAVQSILTTILSMPKVLARLVPRILTDDQKRTWLYISRYLFSRFGDDPSDFIKRVVTQDETWVHHFDPKSKMQRKQWKHPRSPPPKNFNRVHSAEKEKMASIFWDSQCYLEYYAGELRRLY